MDYVRSDPKRGHLYRCRDGGCHLKTRKGVRYCRDEIWENREDNPRLFPSLPRASPEWKSLYRLRQSFERAFRGLKKARRLESHYHRGVLRVALHCLLSLLAYQLTSLVRLLLGQEGSVTRMVRAVG